MEMSEQINELTAALSALSADIRDVSKDTQGYGYKYAAIDSYLTVARPLLAKHGLALFQAPSAQGDTVTVTSMLSHKSGQWMRSELSMPVELKKGLSMAQCMGMVITYARRYSLAAMLGMSAEDSDASVAESTPADFTTPTKDVYGELLKALDSGDGWHVLAIAADQPAFRLAYGRLTGKHKTLCKELETRTASARFDYMNNLIDYAASGDELGAQQLLDELSQNERAKRMVWEQLDSKAREFIKSLKREAA
jgi:hypothetical protein